MGVGGGKGQKHTESVLFVPTLLATIVETVQVVYKTLHNEAMLYMKEPFLKLSDRHTKQGAMNFSTDLYLPR